MRILANIKEAASAKRFSFFLSHKNIQNLYEQDPLGKGYSIWIYDENLFEPAESYYKKYLLDCNSSAFNAPVPRPKIIKKIPKQTKISSTTSIPPLTIATLLLCTLIFIAGIFNTPLKKNTNIPSIFSPIKKQLLFDFPMQYELSEKLIRTRLSNDQQIVQQEKFLNLLTINSPSWPGLEKLFISKKLSWQNIRSYSLMEKIKKGQVWRLFTPCLLHGDFIHLIFNMMWLATLSSQIERKIGMPRLIIMSLLIGIISNTAQYIMSGPVFLGYSGIICGMLTFIWQRQKNASWELYDLSKSTISFISLFIVGMLLLQIVSTFTVYFGYKPLFQTNIANTAHIIGGIVGYLIGKQKLFAAR